MFSLCKPVSSKRRFLPHRRISDTFTFTLFDNALQLGSDWDEVTKGQTVFLEREYLRIIQNGGHSRLQTRYVIVYADKKPCGVMYFQIIDFKAGIFGELMNTQVEKIRSARLNLFEKYIDSNKEEILLRLFTCGNNLVSGEYGFRFLPGFAKKTSTDLLLEIIGLISEEEKLRAAISAVLIKDFPHPLEPKSHLLKEKYSDFLVEPNLIVTIPPGIEKMDDYVGLFSKKYRNRARAIFRKFEQVETRYLEVPDILKYKEKIYALYSNIFERAKFKLIKLPENYFEEVKRLYPERFNVKGFFLGEDLIAFSSCFRMPDGTLEAHYIGFDYALNTEFDIYQNILYSMIGEALRQGSRKVNLGRTAAEIKTTVGARPQDLICYIKPQNTISKIIQKPFISFLKPAEWTPRNPFKEMQEDDRSPVSFPETTNP